MTWDSFYIFAAVAAAFWAAGATEGVRGKSEKRAILLTCTGITVFAVFIIGFWITLKRPPMRTMGETRLWYSFFMAIAGLFTYCRWKYRWILPFSAMMSCVFIAINIAKPEIHSQTLPDILQSGWFIPHVTIYMFSYALFGCALLLSIAGLVKKDDTIRERLLYSIDELVTIGLSFFTIGMLFGALWAKEAWGTFWSWDPKESWALATFLLYAGYLHLRHIPKLKKDYLFIIIVFSFLSLQICWWGVNYLPNSGESVHTYNVK